MSDIQRVSRRQSDGNLAQRGARSGVTLVGGLRCLAFLAVLAVEWRARRIRGQRIVRVNSQA